jgi:hypothetical protein
VTAVLYYVVVAFSVAYYAVQAKRVQIGFVSYSTLTYAVAVVMVMIPGYSIIMGQSTLIVRYGLSHGFDRDLYLIYLAYLVMLPVAIVGGNGRARRLYLKAYPRELIRARARFLVVLSIIYGILYLLWLPVVPINTFIKGGSSAVDLAERRIEVTHQQATSGQNLPLVFRYWRVVIQDVSLALFTYLLLTTNRRRILSMVPLGALFMFLIYGAVFTLEKAPLGYIVICTCIAPFLSRDNRVPTGSNTHRQRSTRRLRYSSLLRTGLLLGSYIATLFAMFRGFMGAEMASLAQGVSTLWSRISAQTASTYVEIQMCREMGFLGFRGIDMPILKHLFDYGYTNLSTSVSAILDPVLASRGYVGAAGNMSLASLYFCFSWFSLPIFLALVFLVGYFDRLFMNSIHQASGEARAVGVAFYSAFSALHILAPTGSLFDIFAIPTILNPAVILFMVPYFFLMHTRFTLFRTGKPRAS